MNPGDTPGGPRRPSKPTMTTPQQRQLVDALEGVRTRHNSGWTLEKLDSARGGDIDTVRELLAASSDAIDFITTLTVHGSMKVELANFLGISPMKKSILEDVIEIQAASRLQTLNISPRELETLCKGLSRELVRQIDGVDYSAPVKPTQQTTPPKFETAEEILAFMNRKPEPIRQAVGPVSRVWGYATHSSKTILDLLAILPESLGTAPAASGGKRVNVAEGDAKPGKRTNQPDDSPAKPVKRTNLDVGGDTGGKAPKQAKKPTKASLRAHIEGLNGEASASLKKQLLAGLSGGKSLDWALEILAEAGLPTPS